MRRTWYQCGMSGKVTLYRFQIDLSDVDRGVYDALDFRVAMHPSETEHYLLARVLAYALNFERGLEFSPQGLSDPDIPAIRKLSDTGEFETCIEIGTPSAKRLHKAAKAASQVKVYTYKDPKNMMREATSQPVHKIDAIEFYSFAPKFLDRLAQVLDRDNKWSLMHVEGSITVSTNKFSEQGEVIRHSLSEASQ